MYEGGPFFVCKSCILAVGFRILKIDLPVGYIQVSAKDNRFFCLQLLKISKKCLQKGFMDFFREADADIFCIQESKMQKGQLELELPG